MLYLRRIIHINMQVLSEYVYNKELSCFRRWFQSWSQMTVKLAQDHFASSVSHEEVQQHLKEIISNTRSKPFFIAKFNLFLYGFLVLTFFLNDLVSYTDSIPSDRVFTENYIQKMVRCHDVVLLGVQLLGYLNLKSSCQDKVQFSHNSSACGSVDRSALLSLQMSDFLDMCQGLYPAPSRAFTYAG